MSVTGVTGTPLPLTPVAATSPLADIRTLAYHQWLARRLQRCDPGGVAEAAGDGGRQLLVLDSNEINVVRIRGDGRTIVFRIYRDTTVRGTSPSESIQRGIFAINPDGSGLRQLVGPDDIASISGVSPDQAGFFGASSGVDVSANGAQIVFAMFVPAVAGGDSGEGLFGVTFDGSRLRKLVDDTNVTATAISGDGSRVAFVTYIGATGHTADQG